MKKLSLAVIAAVTFASMIPAAQAAVLATGQFDVTISLTSACKYSKTADVAFTYTSLQAAASTATPGGFTLQCTNTVPYTLALDSTGVTDLALNLAYTVALSAASGTGDGTAKPYSVTGSMAASQAGTCLTAACTNASSTNKTRTLTVSF